MLYLDYAATTPMSKKALEAYIHTSENYFHNTESLHACGQNSKDLLEHARTSLAELIGKESRGIYFTGGGSDGNFLALTSLVFGSQKGKHILSSNIEHPSVDYTLNYLEKNGFEVTRVPVDSSGSITIEEINKHIRPDTILATIQHVNSETGTMQDIESIGGFLNKKGILFHSDCVQSFTKVKMNHFKSIKLDAFTMSAHKIFGPKGTGAVYISPKIHISPILSHVTHEQGFRPGTVDLPSVVAFVTAASDAINKHSVHYKHVSSMRNLFTSLILENNNIIIEGSLKSSPYILPIRIKSIEGQIVMQELNRMNISVSTGSACQNGQQEPSRTLLAIGRTDSEAHGLVRISFSHLTKEKDIYDLCKALNEISNKLSSVRGVPS
ncbi:IscS subfamily cysteine desulfurase [Bacillus sp. NEB1478]|uniref:IscS subfamily cysteine desulfurase n=1 Tax=Bacillus sp. NEB1478 TaxID=3073816 RepID=UPI0028734F36|nr:IscS subfamily cysteine desulfurase [Bacillus sp. NEB1478]WNB93280.1 IscS subfamily cysteine desulfurase [Bacillus sp. NEB1478]